MELLKRTLDLCKAVEQHQQGQQAQQQLLLTPFRRLVTCMLAVREIEEDQLSSELLWKLMADTGNSGLKIFTGKSKELKTKDIRAFTVAYGRQP